MLVRGGKLFSARLGRLSAFTDESIEKIPGDRLAKAKTIAREHLEILYEPRRTQQRLNDARDSLIREKKKLPENPSMMRSSGGSPPDLGFYVPRDYYIPTKSSMYQVQKTNFSPKSSHSFYTRSELNSMDPLEYYKDPGFLSHFITFTGGVLPRQKTGFTKVNQRKLSKAISRAKALCLISPISNVTV